MSSSIKIQAYRCVWDGRWMQYHDHTDPLPDKWDDEPPDEVAALVLKTDADFEIDRLREVFRVNMLRLAPETSHEEIDRVLNGEPHH